MGKYVIAAYQLVFCVLMLMASLFFEFVVKLTPCALCLFQRFLVVTLIIMAFATLIRLLQKKSAIVYRVISILIAGLGMLVAWRHIWLQQNASLAMDATCLPDISYMLKVMSLPQVAFKIFSQAGAECSKIKWSLFGYSMPFWVGFMYFIYITSQLISVYFERKN